LTKGGERFNISQDFKLNTSAEVGGASTGVVGGAVWTFEGDVDVLAFCCGAASSDLDVVFLKYAWKVPYPVEFEAVVGSDDPACS
jgi:hypothetical protein